MFDRGDGFATNKDQEACEAYIIEYKGIHCIHGNCCSVEVRREDRSGGEGDGNNERCEEVEERLVDLLEDEDLGADFPPAELPVEKDVAHVVVHARDEEIVPLRSCNSRISIGATKEAGDM